jgi:hypothetical protein
MPTDRYLEAHQARKRLPTIFEDLLGDALERAFGAGAQTLSDVVASLNRSGPSNENGEAWTEQNFQALMARLAD